MIAEKAREAIQQAVCYELQNIVKEHGAVYNSGHEANAILKAVPKDIEEGARIIEKCPECGKKLYIQRNDDKVRVHCGGCGVDVTAEVIKKDA